MDEQDAVLHRLTGRRTLHFPLTTNARTLRQAIVENRVRFVVVPVEKQYVYYSPSPARRFEDVKRLDPTRFKAAHVFDQGTIYEVVPSDR